MSAFSKRLCGGLRARRIRAEIRWFPFRAKYAPWTVPVPTPPEQADMVGVIGEDFRRSLQNLPSAGMRGKNVRRASRMG